MTDSNALSIRARNMLDWNEFLDANGYIKAERLEELKELVRSRAVLRWRNMGMKTFRELCDILDVEPDAKISIHTLTVNESRMVRAMRKKDANTILKLIRETWA